MVRYRLLIPTLILYFHVANISNACMDSCGQSDCCESTYSCQSQSNCCQASSSCQNKCRSCYNTCNAGCKTRNCATWCKQNCCNDNKDVTQTVTETHTTAVVSPSTSANLPQLYKFQNTNNGTFQSNLNLRNEINTVNNISVPISVHDSTKINVQIFQIPNESTETFSNVPDIVFPPANAVNISINTVQPTPNVTTPKSTNYSEFVPERIPVLIPIPSKPIYVPTPKPMVITQPIRPVGCCLNFSPCLSNESCLPYQQTCGEQCIYRYQYYPINPCLYSECQKRQFATSWSCYFGSCQPSITNCNYCNDYDFYRNFNNFRRCGGCYYR